MAAELDMPREEVLAAIDKLQQCGYLQRAVGKGYRLTIPDRERRRREAS
jgi:biotin operon repressor